MNRLRVGIMEHELVMDLQGSRKQEQAADKDIRIAGKQSLRLPEMPPRHSLPQA